MDVKRIIISLLFIFFVFFPLYCYSFWGTTAKTAENDLVKEGFADVYIFPIKGVILPSFFVDKYTFVESSDNTIFFTNVLTGEKKIILQLDWLGSNCGIIIHSLKNDEMFFSTKDGKEFSLYNLTNKTLAFIRYISLESDKKIRFSYIDGENQCIYIEQGYVGDVYCYDLFSDSSYIKKQHYEQPHYQGLYPFSVFTNDTKEKEVHCVTEYNDNFYPADNVQINDDEYLVINRCKRLVSELCIINLKTETSRLFRLKDFGYEITGLYQVDDDEYCFIVKCQDNSRVFCYFSSDMLVFK